MVNLQKVLLGTTLLVPKTKLECPWFSFGGIFPVADPGRNSIPVGKEITLNWNGCTLSNVTNPISLYLTSGDINDSDQPGAGFVAWISTSMKIRGSFFHWNVTLDPFSSMPSHPSNVPWVYPAPKPGQCLQQNVPYKFAFTDGLCTLIRSEYSFSITNTSEPPSSTPGPATSSTTGISLPSKTSGAMANAPYWGEGKIRIGLGVLVLSTFWVS